MSGHFYGLVGGFLDKLPLDVSCDNLKGTGPIFQLHRKVYRRN